MEIRQCENQEQLKQLADLADVIWHEYFVSLLSKEQIDYMVENFNWLYGSKIRRKAIIPK